MKKMILCILIILLNLVFIISSTIILKFYNNVYRIRIFIDIAFFSNFLCAFYLANNYPKLRFTSKYISMRTQNTLIAISCTLTVFSYSMFIAFLPAYTVKDAYSIIKADPMYVSSNIIEREGVCITDKHGNPFAGYGYTFDCEKNGVLKGKIYFNPLSSEYSWNAIENEYSR